jgi:phage-related minor tail protein
MAFSLGDAIVYFKGDDSQLTKDLDGAEKKTTSFVGSAGKLLGGALAGAAVAGAAAIVGIGAAALDVSAQTQQATADIAANLGIPTAEAERFGEVARQVYGNNFADSVTDAGTAVAELAKQLGLTADDPALKTMTENAFRLRDTFGVEITDSVSTVKTLMENFGLSSEEAFDMIAAGYQKGLDRSGDFLDSVNEYSVQFSNGGASAEQFFTLMESGLQGGMLGTDKAADAFKEFQVRILDGSAATSDALNLIGINADEFTGKLASGQMSTADAFNMVIGKLGEVEDGATLMQAGVGLIGTQFEDLGIDAALALTTVGDGFTNVEGSVESLDSKYQTFGSAVEGVWRRLTTSLSPFTDKLLELVNDAMPSVMSAFDTFDNTVVPIIENIGTVIGTMVTYVKGLFQNDVGAGIETAASKFDFIGQKVNEIMPYIQTIIETVLGTLQALWTAHGETVMEVVGNAFSTIQTVIETVTSVVLDTIKVFLQVLTGDWEGAAQTLKDIVTSIWDGILEIFRLQLNSIGQIVGDFDLGDAGGALINSLRRGIENKWNELKSWWRRKIQELRDMLPFSEPKDPSSPLRNLHKAGEGLVEQFQKGLDSATFSSSFLNPLAGGVGTGGIGAVSIVQNFYGPAEPEAVNSATQSGLRRVFRQRGLA